MSREFGDYHASGYFHTKLENAAEDADMGNWAQTMAMGPVLRALYQAAYVCSSIEEHDRSSNERNYAEWRRGMEHARELIDEALEIPPRFDGEVSP
jgi:hypothetical protein